MTDPMIAKAIESLDELSADEEVRRRAYDRETQWHLYQVELGEAHRGGHAKGLSKGRANMLALLLECRFGSLAPAVRKRLERGSEEQLAGWAKRVLTAKSLEEVFA